jgi:hypothetical protein
MPHPGRQWAARGGRHRDPDREPRRRRRATYNRYGGVRHLFAALDLGRDKLYGHIKPVKRRTEFLVFCRYLRTLYPPELRLAIVCDNFSPHLTTKKWRPWPVIDVCCGGRPGSLSGGGRWRTPMA